MRTKKCSRCGEELPVVLFGKNAAKPDGLQSWCKLCRRDYERYYSATKDVRCQDEPYCSLPTHSDIYDSICELRSLVSRKVSDFALGLLTGVALGGLAFTVVYYVLSALAG